MGDAKYKKFEQIVSVIERLICIIAVIVCLGLVVLRAFFLKLNVDEISLCLIGLSFVFLFAKDIRELLGRISRFRRKGMEMKFNSGSFKNRNTHFSRGKTIKRNFSPYKNAVRHK